MAGQSGKLNLRQVNSAGCQCPPVLTWSPTSLTPQASRGPMLLYLQCNNTNSLHKDWEGKPCLTKFPC